MTESYLWLIWRYHNKVFQIENTLDSAFMDARAQSNYTKHKMYSFVVAGWDQESLNIIGLYILLNYTGLVLGVSVALGLLLVVLNKKLTTAGRKVAGWKWLVIYVVLTFIGSWVAIAAFDSYWNIQSM